VLCFDRVTCDDMLQPTPPAHALLTAGDPIKNAQAILRYALPIDNKPIRQIQVRPAGSGTRGGF